MKLYKKSFSISENRCLHIENGKDTREMLLFELPLALLKYFFEIYLH